MNLTKDFNSFVSIKDLFIPLTNLNRGGCAKILEDLKTLKYGFRIIAKNNKAEGIIMSCEYFDSMKREIIELQAKIEAYEEERIYLLTKERLESFDSSESVSEAELMLMCGLTEEDIANAGEADFE